MMDDFSSVKEIALDSYAHEIEPFDPRNDGYAAKLRSFFVRDGKRYFFLPLEKNFGNTAWQLNRKIAPLLGDVSYSFSLLEKKTSVFWYFIVFAASACAALYFSRSRLLFAFQLPLLFAFGWFGSSAFILAAMLAGIWELLREPLEEISASRRYRKRNFNYAGLGFRGLKERLWPFRRNLILAALFVIIYITFSNLWELHPLFCAAGLVCFSLLYYFSLIYKTAQIKKNRHVPFTPVLLIPFRIKTFSLFPLLLPFGAGALLALILPLLAPGFSSSREKDPAADPRYLVSAEDYRKHMDFQHSFSYRSLNDMPLSEDRFLGYYLGNDGLIAGSYEERLAPGRDTGDAEFPLEKLMGFLVQYNNPGMAGTLFFAPFYPVFNIKEWISVALLLVVSFLDFVRSGAYGKKKKGIPVYRDKRIAA
jgi:hypothetical protein